MLQNAILQFRSKFTVNYPYGMSGICAGIAYMIQNKFFEIESDELFAKYDDLLGVHVLEFLTLSSINQILGIAHYVSIRIKDCRDQDILFNEMIGKLLLLIDLHLMREPYWRADIATVLYSYKDKHSKIEDLFNLKMSQFDNKLITEDPWGWFLFFYKTKALFPEQYDVVNSLINNNKALFSENELVMWGLITGLFTDLDLLNSVVNKAIAKRNYGLQNGLAGIGMSILQSIDIRHSTWLDLLIPIKSV